MMELGSKPISLAPESEPLTTYTTNYQLCIDRWFTSFPFPFLIFTCTFPLQWLLSCRLQMCSNICLLKRHTGMRTHTHMHEHRHHPLSQCPYLKLALHPSFPCAHLSGAWKDSAVAAVCSSSSDSLLEPLSPSSCLRHCGRLLPHYQNRHFPLPLHILMSLIILLHFLIWNHSGTDIRFHSLNLMLDSIC